MTPKRIQACPGGTHGVIGGNRWRVLRFLFTFPPLGWFSFSGGEEIRLLFSRGALKTGGRKCNRLVGLGTGLKEYSGVGTKLQQRPLLAGWPLSFSSFWRRYRWILRGIGDFWSSVGGPVCWAAPWGDSVFDGAKLGFPSWNKNNLAVNTVKPAWDTPV